MNEDLGDESLVVPIARFSLGENVEETDYDLACELVDEGLDALQSALGNVFVRHYDILVTFDGDELFGS